MCAEFFTVDKISKSFGHLKALNGVTLELSEGEILGLIGPNGSGKTTLINVISGIFNPDSGTVNMEGKKISGLRSYKIARLGINRTYQTPRPFSSLTVEENLRVSMVFGHRRGESPSAAHIERVLEMLGLSEHRKEVAASLNTFHKKMLDLARAMVTSPKILLVDELAAGLNPDELNQVSELLKSIREGGTSLIVVEHVMSFIRTVSERLIVMDAGEKIFEGDYGGAVKDEHVKEVYLGRRSYA